MHREAKSADPGFFDNIRDAGAALGPGLVRIDNIYTHYDIVHRGADGLLTYDWSKLDRVLDGRRRCTRSRLYASPICPKFSL